MVQNKMNEGVKIHNFESQYRTLKRDIQVASGELTGLFGEIKTTEVVLAGIRKELQDKHLDIQALVKQEEEIAAKIQQEERVLTDWKQTLKSKLEAEKEKHQKAMEETMREIADEKKKEGLLLKELQQKKAELVELVSEKRDLSDSIFSLEEEKKSWLEEIKNLSESKKELRAVQDKEQEKLDKLNNEVSSARKDLAKAQKDFQDKMASIARYKQGCKSVEEAMKTKERDLSILALRLRNEFKKIGRETIPINPILIPKYEETKNKTT